MRLVGWLLACLLSACGAGGGGQGGDGGAAQSGPDPEDDGSPGGDDGAGGEPSSPSWPPPGYRCEQDAGTPCSCPDGYDGVYQCMDTGWCACPSGVCGTELSGLTDEEDACLEQHCCDGIAACMADGFEACWDCLEAGGGAACDELLACDAMHDCSIWLGPGVCTMGVRLSEESLDGCVEANCCGPFFDCLRDGTWDFDGCRACVEAGGGARCDAYLACVATACGDAGGESGGGGAGGSGGSGGGTDGAGGADGGTGGS